MSTRPNWFRFVISIFAFALFSASICVVNVSAQVAPVRLDSSAGVDKKSVDKDLMDELFPYSSSEAALPTSSGELISASTYAFAALTGVSLEDMSSGTTQLVAASQDDTVSPVIDIGFDFWFDGVRHSQFSVNPNGLARLGSTVIAGTFNNSTSGLNTTINAPKIAPYFEDLCTSSTGKVHFKVLGTAPDRKLVVEWTGMQIPREGACLATPDNGVFQMWLYESAAATNPGRIQFVYGAGIGASDDTDLGASIGLQSGAATNFASVTVSDDSVSYTVANNTNLPGVASGKSYHFTPNVPSAAPTGLTFSPVTQLSIQLNWADNATNEVGYAIFRSTDGTNFSFVTQTAADATSFNDTGLFPGTTYFYRVYAATDGAISAPVSGSQATNAAGNESCAGAGGNWSSGASWADASAPTGGDHVTIGSGCTVTIDVTTAAALSVSVQTGGTLQFIDTPAASLAITQGLTVATGGTVQSAATGTTITHVLSVGGDLVNNGTLDLSTNTDTAGAELRITGSANNTFSGTGTNDLRLLTISKGSGNVTTSSPTLDVNVSNMTVRGLATGGVGFLNTTVFNGIVKFSGTNTFNNPVFTAAAYTIPITGGVWFNNPNFTVAGQNGSPTTTGLLRVTSGTFNVGTASGNSMGGGTGGQFIFEGGTSNFAGRLQTASAVSYTQSGGTVNVCTIGNTATTACFGLTGTTNIFNMTGGSIVLNLPNTNAVPLDYSVSTAATFLANPAGTTLQLGSGTTPAATTFRVVGATPNLVINAGHSMAVGSGTAGAAVFLRGSTVTNNGAIVIQGTGTSSRFDWAANGPMTYGGTGTFGTAVTPFAGVGMSANSGNASNTTVNSPIFINRINVFAGGFINTNQITLGNGGASTTVIQVGNSTTPTDAGTFDVSPVYNSGTGGHILLHLRTTTLNRVVGFEMNPTRNLAALTFDNNAAGATLGLGSGNLTISGTATGSLALTNGVMTLAAPNTLFHTAGTATRTTGYLNGNLSRTFAAAAAYTYHVGQNGYSPVLANVTAGTFPATLSANATQTAHPAFLNPSLALSRYWSLTEGGDLTADLTFNYLDPADIPGTATEANFVIFKHDGAFTMPGGTVTPATNMAAITGVTSFSDWTLAEPGAVVGTPGTLAFSAATYAVGEAGPTALLTVNRTGGSAGAVSVDYTLGGGTATGGAACGGNVDYVNTGGTLMFANAETTKSINVPICNDSVFEGTETFDVTLSNATGGATIGSPNPATVSITDDEGQPTVQFSSATYNTIELRTPEGTVGALITVTLSGPSQAPVTVDYATAAGGTATGGAACTAGVDYLNTSGTLTFPSNDVSEFFTILTCPDSADEPDETVNLALTNPMGATLGTPNTAVLTIIDNDGPASPVTVTATAGTTGPTGYNTVKEAFDAINAGTHQGSITVLINADTTETASAVLNASGGTASYTSVLVRPTATAVVSGSIVGAIIKLNGADNVTIDGRIGGTGSARSLSVINNQAATATAAIWLSSTGAGAGATNNVIRNLELACGVTQNTSALSTFGIAMTGATIGVAVNGDDNDNNAFLANRIIRSRYGIMTRGNPTNLNLSTVVADNIIGPAAFGPDEIGKTGVFLQADAGAVISRNTVQFVGGLFGNTTAGADRIGIALGVESWGSAPTALAGTDYTVTRNVIHDVIEERTFSAVGILASVTNGANPTNNLVANNFIYNVNANGTVGDTAIGIGVAAGNGDRVVFNSVRMAGDQDPTAAAAAPTQNPMNLRVANAPTNLTVKNNSLYNDLFSSSAPTLQSANIQLPSATFAFGTGGLNNNNYYFPPTNMTARTGAVGTTSVPTTFYQTLANWQAAVTPQDANSIQADPQYVSPTDLHIALTSPNVNAGATGTAVVNDIDFQVRDAMPDIGADEPNGATAPANDIAAVSIISPAPGSTQINGTSVTPQARFYNAGSATQTGVMVQFTITGPGGYAYTNTQTIASIGPDEFVTVTFATAPVFTTAGSYMMTASVITPDSNASNDSVMGSFTVINPLSGTYTVGAGGNFTSLTNPGGLFDLLNTAGASANVTADIISDLTGETGAIPLNQLPGGFGLTIKPSGAPRTISGTAASLSMIKLNGADNITIDGSLSGGTDRSLTILYTNTGGTVIWIAAQNASNGANNNTIKNSIIASNPGTLSVAGILAGSGTTLGGAAEAQNNNNTIQNNDIYRVQNSFYNQGNTGFDQNWMIIGNQMGNSAVGNRNTFRGMLIGNAQNFVINGNSINGLTNTSATAGIHASGIQLAFLINGGTITNNRISDLRQTGTQGSYGMQIGSTSPAANVTIANNFLWDIAATGSATVALNGHGINIIGAGAGGYRLYHNSINMNATQASGTTSALHVSGPTAAGALDVRNNIFANTAGTGATRRSVHSVAAATVYVPINYNDYFSTGSVGFIGGVDRPTLADWQTGTGQDANSKAVDPLFVSPTDLHIQPTSPMINMGVAGTGITTDIDGQPRDATPDIGADEVIAGAMPGVLQFSAPTYTVGESGPVATITVTRTGGSDGTVTVNYATVAGGTATGGAACGAGIDYVNTSGTLTFIAGDTSETFNVTICQDATDEPNETINLALSMPTGGATIGTQSTAVLTITDDDPTPGSFSINDVRRFEGDSGTVIMTFTVTYTGPSVPASVQYATANGTAIAGVDYQATSGTLFFNSSLMRSPEGGTPTSTLPVNVTIISDVVKEANETFFVNLSNPTNATISDGQGVGIIIDEDRAYVADFDRDLRADFSVFRPSTGVWYVLQSTNDTPKIVAFGTNGDIAVPGDYDGDTLADYAVWRPSTGEWHVLNSSDNSYSVVPWGLSTDIPVQGDFDGDGKTDRAAYRPSTGTWWIIRSSDGIRSATPFGISTDRPVQGDYDGDFKTDIAVYRDGTWYILRSSDGAVQIGTWGNASDLPVNGDFDGDGKYDLAIYRGGVWWILGSLNGAVTIVPYGTASDIPVPGDYDADGTTDRAVFRPSTGDWFVLRSSNNTSFGVRWGTSGDQPIPAGY